MPPKRCPQCATSLDETFVQALGEQGAACPACGVPLVPPIRAGASGDRAHEVSVRPPDLAPASVRDRPDDVLAGWDLGADAAEIAAWRRDRRPFPTDTVVVIGSALLACALGAAIASPHRGRNAVLGAVSGLLGAGVGRRIWRLRT